MNQFILLTGNLFDEAWTQGNLYEIQPIVNALGTFSTWIISIVGFCIVIFSILKNALSGLYVINPQLWDRVDQVKNAFANGPAPGGGQQGGNQAVQKLGGILINLLKYIPNVKDLTDFADEQEMNNINKKQYFAHAIPLLIGQIFIGMLIFQGYPAQIANWIGSGGTHIISAFINNVDPIEFVENVSDSFVSYDLATDGSPEVIDQNINKMVQEIMPAIKTKYSDMLAEPTQQVAYYVESEIQKALTQDSMIQSIVNAQQGYVYAIQSSASSTFVQDSNAFTEIPGYANARYAVATNGTYSIKVTLEGSSMPTGSTIQDNYYFTVTLNCTPSAVSGASTVELIGFGGYTLNPTTHTPFNPLANGVYEMKLNGLKYGNDYSGGDITGKLGDSCYVALVGKDGNVIVATNSGKIEKSDATASKNAQLRLTVADQNFVSEANKHWSTTGNGGGENCYIKVVPNGSWSKVSYNASNNKITLAIKEMRFHAKNTDATYAISTWTDVTDKVYKGIELTVNNIDKAVIYTNSDLDQNSSTKELTGF